MADGYPLEGGKFDRYGRALEAATRADGRDARGVLIAEGLAQAWPDSGNVWCE